MGEGFREWDIKVYELNRLRGIHVIFSVNDVIILEFSHNIFEVLLNIYNYFNSKINSIMENNLDQKNDFDKSGKSMLTVMFS